MIPALLILKNLVSKHYKKENDTILQRKLKL